MRRIQFFVPFIVLALVACATFVGKGRMENFTTISEAYEFSLLDSNYRGAARFISPSVKAKPLDEKHSKNIKIVEYNITHMNVAPDKLEVVQEVELKYFLLNSNRLRTTRHRQEWRYNVDGKAWLLYTDLPKFLHKQ